MPLELATTCRDVACRVSIILVYQEKGILADGDAARHVSTDFFVSLIQCLLGICQTIDNNLNCQWFIFQQLRITFYRRIHLFQREVPFHETNSKNFLSSIFIIESVQDKLNRQDPRLK